MYRKSSGFPSKLVTRIGTVDDFSLHEGALKPRVCVLILSFAEVLGRCS
jgi:hypothetical protein